MTRFRISSAVVLLIAFVTAAATLLQSQDDVLFAIKKNLSIFGALYEELAVGYVDPVDPERFMRTGLESMLETLDPYTVFIDEAANEDIDIARRGRFAGVGLSIALSAGRITVITPIEGYSGFRQGVRAGDVIVEVDGRSVDELTPEDVTQLLLGDPGTSVGLSVERQGEVQPIEFILTREEVRVKNVSFADFVNGTAIGYIKLERFGHEAHSEVAAGLKSLREQGPLEGLVLDLRDNPGGLLEAAVDIAGLFVPQGTEVVSTRGRLPQSERSYRSRRVPFELETPLAVLVNRSSASASEIVAGAIQDLDRGVVVGERTFGKGLVQVVRPLPYNTSVKMTTSKYYTPSGRSIQSVNYTHRAEDGYAVVIADSLQEIFTTEAGREVRGGGGIAPDVEVAFAKPSGLEEALIRKSAFFRFANRFAAENPEIPQDFVPTAETIESFRQWLDEDGFNYVDRTEWLLDEIQSRAAEVDYSVGREVEALRSSIEREKAGDFERYNDELREHLRREILARYYGESALIRASLTHDRQLETSIEILSDQEKLDDILGTGR